MSLRLVGQSVFVAAPDAKTFVGAYSFYTRAAGLELCAFHNYDTRSDTTDISYRRFSADNGRTWTEPETIAAFHPTARGTLRTNRDGGGVVFLDTERDALVRVYNEGLFPTDNPMEGMTETYLCYAVSLDGGRTDVVNEPVIQPGAGYDRQHPLAGVWVGRNSVQLGDLTCTALRTRAGDILQPVQITPLGPDGKIANPGGGYTYHDAAVLIGRWTDGHRLAWDVSERVVADPARTTRGFIEPTLAEMPDGRILMVLRGSNDKRPALPGYRWYSISADGGRTWSTGQPWHYDDGTPFFSPSSCSQLLRHANGHTYWIGNISAENPRGNHPRYPLVIGQVDDRSLMLVRDSVCVVEQRGTNDHADMALSNFQARTDRQTGEIVLHLSPFFRQGFWHADACLYRIAV